MCDSVYFVVKTVRIKLEKIRVHSKTIMKLKLQALDFFLTIAGDMEHTVCGPHNGNGVG